MFECGGTQFTVKGKTDISLGYTAIEKLLFNKTENEKHIPDFYKGQSYAGIKADIEEKFTQPPKPYTEDSLLSAMETAGAKETSENAERKGLGTPAQEPVSSKSWLKRDLLNVTADRLHLPKTA